MKQTLEQVALLYERRHIRKMHGYIVVCSASTAFKAGADWQQQQSPWISIKETLPKANTQVFVLAYPQKTVHKGFWNGRKWSVDAPQQELITVLTHWMPIPCLPKGGEE